MLEVVRTIVSSKKERKHTPPSNDRGRLPQAPHMNFNPLQHYCLTYPLHTHQAPPKMSADHDGDSQMVSSPSDSELESNNRIKTPANPVQQQSTLSPPDSQHRSVMPTSASGAAIANANGKRPLNTISNGADETEEVAAMQAGGSGVSGVSGAGKAAVRTDRAEFATKTHERSGYQWNREEDTPAYAWMNKKALDEYHRAIDGLVHKEVMVRGEFTHGWPRLEECG